MHIYIYMGVLMEPTVCETNGIHTYILYIFSLLFSSIIWNFGNSSCLRGFVISSDIPKHQYDHVNCGSRSLGNEGMIIHFINLTGIYSLVYEAHETAWFCPINPRWFLMRLFGKFFFKWLKKLHCRPTYLGYHITITLDSNQIYFEKK